MVTLVQQDLEFILQQIIIAEQHAAGGDLAELVGHPLLPYGLRTVDGSYNNIVPGRETWGASGQPFPVLSGTPQYGDDQDGDTIGLGPTTTVTNTDYGQSGDVVDADPRIISNLIADQTLNNPAALRAALQYAGLTGPQLTAAETQILGAHDAVQTAEQALANATAAKAAAAAAVDAAEQTLFDLIASDATPEEIDAAFAALNGLIEAQVLAGQAETAAQTTVTQATATLDGFLNTHGVQMSGDSIVLPNVAPDEGLSAPYNSWFTLFGQFFDHGLDLVAKGGNGTVYIPLQPDDPLYVEGSHTNFMVLTRTSGPDAANVTTPWVDQNQTYTSHPSHQVFLREYEMVDGKPVATGHLLEGADGGLATWADIKAQAREMLGIELTDADVGMVPLLRTDPYGKFIPDPDTGFAQVIVGVGADGIPNTADDITVSGTPDNPVSLANAIRTPNAFLDDIAHNAAPVLQDGQLRPDGDSEVGYSGGVDSRGQNTAYDNELLDAHFITGDGRGNENIGLTAVHHVFHAEHNRLVEHVKDVVLGSGDLTFINSWLLEPVDAVPSDASGLQWNGERLFQAARFTTEMQYQHLVFEEFARKVQPDIDVFMVQPNVELDPAIFAEFAHVVYRFGHSMLNETVDRVGADGSDSSMTLFDAFLNPLAFNTLGTEAVTAEVGAGAIIRGMTGQVGNEIDEFTTDALRNNLLGLPLDLATLNIARARETGMPTLNEARAKFQELAGGDTQLDPYTSWTDFALNLKNPASVVNFIAAYGTHQTILDADTMDEKRDAALKLVMGGAGAPADRLDFLNARGAWAGDETLGGLQKVDFWIGGLAEKKMAFGGMLGSTFSFVFELQMENLQNADRFYYLSRTQGMNLLTELENNSLAKIIQRNTDLGETGFALPADVFSTPDFSLYVDAAKQASFGHTDPTHEDPFLEALSSKVERGDNYIRFNGLEHVVIAGTEEADTIISGGGDDGVWGFGGNDRIEAGYGVDKVMGGAGDDIITNAGTDIGETDMLHGDDGNDVIQGGSGLSLIFGGKGQDAIILGPDGSEARGGTGNDFVLGREGSDIIFGNEGDDWVEAGANFDYIAGDNGDIFFNSPIIGHDVLNGGSGDTDYDADSGDDIMFGGEGIQKFIGMWGFDWATYKGQASAVDADMGIPFFTTLPLEVLRDRFSEVEGISGWNNNDILRGDDRTFDQATAADPTPEGNFQYSELDQAGIDRIAGLEQIVTSDLLQQMTLARTGQTANAFAHGNIMLGGGGSDTIEGRGGDDIIDGDAWLDVQIRVNETLFIDSLAQIQNQLLIGTINPGDLSIVRSIKYADAYAGNPAAIDRAVYSDVRANYEITERPDGTWIVAHTGGTGADGTDRLRNIEVLQFADGLWAPENGSLSLSSLAPREGQTLTATIVDPDGVNATSASITWEAETAPGVWTAIPGATGPTLVLTQDQVALAVRAVATYTDGLGVSFSVTSAATALVGDYFLGTNASEEVSLSIADDVALGNGGADTLSGLAGNDSLNGGTGNDSLLGGDGTDTLVGEAGNDILDGGAGADTLEGGLGNDVYVVDNAADVVIEAAGGGTDEVRTTLTSFTLGAEVENLTYLGGQDFTGIGNELANRMNGGTANNTLIGLDGNDALNGQQGHDSLVGGAGNDTLSGGLGNDTLDGGDGADRMFGGDGNDLFRVNDAGDVVIEGGTGMDTVEASLATYVLTSNVEVLVFTGTGAFSGTGNGLANTIIGGNGDDALSGLTGNDVLEGREGNDQLLGGGGNDTLVGGAGDDVMDGGAGADVFVFGAGFGNDMITNFGTTAGLSQDRLDVSALGIAAEDFATAIQIAGTVSAVVTIGGNSVTLLGVSAATINESDFIFA